MAGIDSFAKLVLHMDGTDTSTTFTDSSQSPYTVTANGNAQIDTAQSKFGGASGLFDGTGDFLSVPDSADWQFDGGSNLNLWTIDFWVMFNGDPGTGEYGFINQYVDGNNYIVFQIKSNGLRIRVQVASADVVDISQSWNPATATWYHVALVKDGINGYMHFVDGSQIGSTTLDITTLPDLAASLIIARSTDDGGSTHDLNGWMDELRISVGAARWTANFTPPTSAYSLDSAKISKLMLMGVS